MSCLCLHPLPQKEAHLVLLFLPLSPKSVLPVDKKIIFVSPIVLKSINMLHHHLF